jgi:chromate transporter
VAAMSQTANVAPAAPIPTRTELFLAFVKITLSGFGGALPWTRRMFVEEKRWLTAAEFNELYALCQFLPGPNIVNMSAVFGSRIHGFSGAIAAWTGFLLVPFCVMLTAGIIYERYSDVEAVRRILTGIAPAAAGLLLATLVKMALPLFRSLGPAPFVFIATACAIGVMRWPLPWVMLVVAPLGVGLTWMWGRR